MRFKYRLVIFLLLLTKTLQAQSKILHVEYQFYFKNYLPEIQNIDLVSDGRESLSTVTRTILYQDYGDINPTNKSFYSHYFKTKDSIYSLEILNDKEYLVSEPINVFKWRLTSNTKEILGYKCQEATTSFRGRNYSAYFTTDIPFKAAPWKFHGLPGVTLAIITDDKKISIKATKFNIENLEYDNIGNPFKNLMNTSISWTTFVKIRKKDWEDFRNKVTSQFSSTGQNKNMSLNPSIHPGLRMDIIIEGEGGQD